VDPRPPAGVLADLNGTDKCVNWNTNADNQVHNWAEISNANDTPILQQTPTSYLYGEMDREQNVKYAQAQTDKLNANPDQRLTPEEGHGLGDQYGNTTTRTV